MNAVRDRKIVCDRCQPDMWFQRGISKTSSSSTGEHFYVIDLHDRTNILLDQKGLEGCMQSVLIRYSDPELMLTR